MLSDDGACFHTMPNKGGNITCKWLFFSTPLFLHFLAVVVSLEQAKLFRKHFMQNKIAQKLTFFKNKNHIRNETWISYDQNIYFLIYMYLYYIIYEYHPVCVPVQKGLLFKDANFFFMSKYLCIRVWYTMYVLQYA